VISVLAAAAYLYVSTTVSPATTHGGVGAYLKMIAGMYAHGFNLRGLPRSGTWMVLGLGVATIACCITALTRHPPTNPTEVRGRLLGVALAWALPSILFWLPQPVPILRHYLLASMGLAAFLGATLLGRFTARRLVVVSAAIATLNLAVPELLYRVYNAHSSPAKAPNGSFFYFHERSVDRIARNNALADRIVSCSSGGQPGDDSPRSCALVTWEGFAHVAYAAATSGRRAEPTPAEMIFPGVRYVRFTIGDGDIRLINYVYFEDPALRAAVARIMEQSRERGYCLFAPRELRERVPELRALGDALQGY